MAVKITLTVYAKKSELRDKGIFTDSESEVAYAIDDYARQTRLGEGHALTVTAEFGHKIPDEA